MVVTTFLLHVYRVGVLFFVTKEKKTKKTGNK